MKRFYRKEKTEKANILLFYNKIIRVSGSDTQNNLYRHPKEIWGYTQTKFG